MSYYPPPPVPGPGCGTAPIVPVQRVSSTRGLSIAALVFVIMTVALVVAEAILGVRVSSGLLRVRETGESDSMLFYDAYDAVAALSTLTFLVGGILTMIWLTQVRNNAATLSPQARHTRSAVWASLGWFIPVVSLWFPLQVVRDARHGFNPDDDVRRFPATQHPGTRPPGHSSPPYAGPGSPAGPPPGFPPGATPPAAPYPPHPQSPQASAGDQPPPAQP